MSNYQNAEQTHNIKTVNKYLKNVVEIFEMIVTNQNCFHDEVKSRLNLGNACYCSVQDSFFFYLESRNVKFKI
jgi:hypothetical protein